MPVTDQNDGSAPQTHATYEYLRVGRVPTDRLQELSDVYFDSEAPDYDHFDVQVERRSKYLRAVNDYVAGKLRESPTCRLIISFGCGTGRREGEIVAMTPHRPRVVGIERVPRMAAIAQSRGLVVVPSVGHLAEVGASSADYVLALYSFVHLPDVKARKQVLRSLAHALRPGGLLILDVFNLHDRFEWASKVADGGRGSMPPTTGRHRGDTLYRRIGHDEVSFMHYFTVAEISALVEEAGLVVVELLGVGHGKNPGELGVPLDAGCILVAAMKPSVSQ
ncbi:MAG TPA: methyltransferase domain-containing protein [Frankiaceae bacterium]|nr:methyltransferase domain-containing protein [Frankiaceae bacterium]